MHCYTNKNMKSRLLILVFAALVVVGCEREQSERETRVPEPEQKFSNLNPDDLANLARQRTVVEAYLRDDESKEKYKTSAGKLGLLRALLQQRAFKPNQTYELQCMGVVLGDVFVQELGMAWIVVEDEYGRDPAVRLGDSGIILFPLTMISKRVERDEEVDVFEMFNGIAARIEELKDAED